MGIQGLIPFLDKVSSRINISQYKGCCVAVDAYCWLHKGAYTCAEKLARGEKCDAYVYYCMKYVNMLLSHNIKPILVFDGRHLPAKAGTEKKRRESRAMNRKTASELLNAGRVDEARNYLRRCVDVTHTMALALIKECRKINVDCIVAPYEADAQLAYLNLQNIAQLVITEDSDLILFGCSKIVFKLDLQGYGLVVERDRLHLSMGLRAENFSFDSFRYMCILSGCDYLPSLPGIGLNKALKFINKTRDPDIHRALRRMPSYLNMTQLKVSEEYRDSFMKADATFRYQPVFDPRSRCLVPLTDPPEGEETPAIVNEQLHPDIAFQLALGNMDPFTLERVDNFNPDCPQQGVVSLQKRSWGSAAASTHPSIWLPDFPGFQPLPEKKQFPGMLNCSAVLDVTPLHKPKVPGATASDEAEENTLPSPSELQSMYGSNKTPLPPYKRMCPTPRDNGSVSNSSENNASPSPEQILQEQTSPILNPRRSRNPFAKPKQIPSAGLGPPGAMGRPNYFSALRKFDGIYPMDLDSNVVILSRYFRSSEITDKNQPLNPENQTDEILKDVSNTSPQVSADDILEEDKIFSGYSCDKENTCDLNSHQNESVLDTIEAAQNKLSSPSQLKHVNISNADIGESLDASADERMEVEIEEEDDVLRQQAENNTKPRSPIPSFNWKQFTSKKSLLSSKLGSSQAASKTFKNPFRKRSATKSIELPLQVNEGINNAEVGESPFTHTALETIPEIHLETQEMSELSKGSPQATNCSRDRIPNSSQDKSDQQLKDVPCSSSPTAKGLCSGRTMSCGDEMVPSEDSLWHQKQQEEDPWSCGSSDSGYQGSQEAPKSVWHCTDKKRNPSTPARSTPTRHRLGLGLAQAPPKQNLLAHYGFSKKRKLSH
ncbi:Exonuclease 1 [Gryllus bimaculatus]|nr:Exonuclease 1 [Gryllus bimaculatus]